MTVAVRVADSTGDAGADDRAFVRDLGRRTVMASVDSGRPAPERAARAAFERLCDIVEAQSHVTLIARDGAQRIGFLLLLDDLPDEVTSLPQAFVAYMAVEPHCRRRGVGGALLAAAEDEAKRRRLPYMALMVTQENAAARRLYERGAYRTERLLLCKRL